MHSLPHSLMYIVLTYSRKPSTPCINQIFLGAFVEFPLTVNTDSPASILALSGYGNLNAKT